MTTLLKSSSRAQAGSGPERRGTRDEGRPHTRLRGGANASGPQRPAAAAAAPSLGRSLSALSLPAGPAPDAPGLAGTTGDLARRPLLPWPGPTLVTQ